MLWWICTYFQIQSPIFGSASKRGFKKVIFWHFLEQNVIFKLYCQTSTTIATISKHGHSWWGGGRGAKTIVSDCQPLHCAHGFACYIFIIFCLPSIHPSIHCDKHDTCPLGLTPPITWLKLSKWVSQVWDYSIKNMYCSCHHISPKDYFIGNKNCSSNHVSTRVPKNHWQKKII